MKYQYFYIIASVLAICAIIWFWVLLRSKTSLNFSLQSEKFTAKTADFPTLKKVLLDKIDIVKRKSSILLPYNHNVMKALTTAAENAKTIDQLGTILLLLPNNSIGTAPLSYLGGKPSDTTLFQFEQGIAGWYWGYATYLSSNIMFYIVRLELGTPEIRAKYNLPLGSTTIYSVSVGAGKGPGTWSYSPFSTCGGTYQALDKNNFSFQCGDDCALNLKMKGDNSGFSLCFGCESGSRGKFESSVRLKISAPPMFNAPQGCFPCAAGSGTLYWSYPQLSAQDGIITLNKEVSHECSLQSSGPLSGEGWLDHQWLRGNDPNQTGVGIITSFIQLGKAVGGLGRYVWINLHLKNNTQYMVTAFPPVTKTIAKGQTYPAKYKKYGHGQDEVYNTSNTFITFQDIVTVKDPNGGEDIIYPTVFSIEIDGNEYTIDTKPYGTCVTMDLTGNLHWSGSATLTSSTDKNTSSAFVELNQFQKPRNYTQNMMKRAGVPVNLIDEFTGAPLKFYQVIPAILVIILGLVLLIAPIVLIIFGIKAQKGKSTKHRHKFL